VSLFSLLTVVGGWALSAISPVLHADKIKAPRGSFNSEKAVSYARKEKFFK
jgi:hypothetical protein